MPCAHGHPNLLEPVLHPNLLERLCHSCGLCHVLSCATLHPCQAATMPCCSHCKMQPSHCLANLKLFKAGPMNCPPSMVPGANIANVGHTAADAVCSGATLLAGRGDCNSRGLGACCKCHGNASCGVALWWQCTPKGPASSCMWIGMASLHGRPSLSSGMMVCAGPCQMGQVVLAAMPSAQRTT